jgi:hypothetical protein
MALTSTEEEKVRQLLTAYDNGKSINDLPAADILDGGNVEIQTPSGESRRVNLISAVSSLNRRIAVRRWNEALSTPAGEAFGNIDFLRELPSLLGLGCYLVTNDRKRRKLDPTNHYRFSDGSPAALDGSMGQYMWCWNAHHYGFRKEGNYYYEAASLDPLPEEWESYYVPAGGTSAIGAGVVDREATGGAGSPRLCSLISELPRYRGGTNVAAWDGFYNSLLGMPASGLSQPTFSVYARERGTGWEANWYVSRAVQEYLFRLIMGTRHSQSSFVAEKDANGLYHSGLGMGATQMGGWTEHNGLNPAIKCSAGVEMGDGVGVSPYAIKNSSGATVYTAPVPVFFGLKNMYGHVWQGVRGLIVDAAEGRTRTYVAPSLYSYAYAESTAGMLLAAENPNGITADYIKSVSMHRLCAMPTAVGATSGTGYCDLFWTYTDAANASYGLRGRLAGGAFDYDAHAGAAACYTIEWVAGAWAHVSVPLCFFEEDPIVE